MQNQCVTVVHTRTSLTARLAVKKKRLQTACVDLCRSVSSCWTAALLYSVCVCHLSLYLQSGPAEIPALRMYRLNSAEAKDRRVVFMTCIARKKTKCKDLHTFDFIFPPAVFRVQPDVGFRFVTPVVRSCNVRTWRRGRRTLAVNLWA